ncbi:MAG: hypothetical protein GYA57_05180 [Myxococcales bacterium]|nr:hypothetical protein [Myxococcales bacterium]
MPQSLRDGLAGLLVLAGLVVPAGCEDDGQEACLFLDVCSWGSSYEGSAGRRLCAANGGTWVEDGCPITAECLGLCDVRTYHVYYYRPFGSAAAARDQCDFEGGVWTEGCGGASAPLDWFTSSCAELGGTTTPTGACFVDCTPSEYCPVEGTACAYGGQQLCRVITGCSSDADCGPAGWHCSRGSCFLRCSADSGGAQGPECPAGFQCADGVADQPVCCRGLDAPSCGEPCPAGCCSPSGLTCCQPPFCSGDCAGSPCC